MSVSTACFRLAGGAILRIALFTFFVAALPAIAQTGGSDPRIGSWTLVSAQSSLNPPDRLSVTDTHGDVHVVMSGETHLDFTVKSDGHDTPVPGNPAFDHVELRKIDKKQAEVTEKKAGATVATIREQISKDGNELAVTTSRKGHNDQLTVWTRSGGAKASKDPLVGDWFKDLSKTRLKQGLMLKVEPNGTNGVNFAGDDSYTARFDGKSYDVKNSRNDTVTLQLIDPHTVEAVYRREDQATQHDRWVVSSDRQRMTLTSTATLETGQHLTETLVFRKQ
jgi:hypothetical protein